MKTDIALRTVTIARRFNGPPGSANGGYACGIVAKMMDGPAKVRLQRPVPLDTELVLEHDGDAIQLRHGDLTIAMATAGEVKCVPPSAPTLDAARRAGGASTDEKRHPFPTCFVCGPLRAAGDGLRIFPGPIAQDDCACVWTPGRELAGTRGVDSLYVWAALDCPTGWAVQAAAQGRVAVLGTFAVEQLEEVALDVPHILTAWRLGQEGRKHFAGGALWTADQRLLAVAEATWIEVAAEVRQ
jgi:hypothetical protein